MQVILWDIDGTLITTRGAGQAAMRRVAQQATGTQPDDRRLKFAGRTDRSIISDHFRTYGIEDTQHNFEEFCRTFVERLPTQLAETEGRVLPGVVEALDRLGQVPDVTLGLLTGNLRQAARIKLDHFGLSDRFLQNGEFVGGFGDHHADRDDVARAAISEARQKLKTEIDPAQVWVVGDTPNDVKCARAIGASVLAVATGQYTLEELSAVEPDLVVDSMLDAHAWWERVGVAG